MIHNLSSVYFVKHVYRQDNSHLKRIISTNCRIHTMYLLMMGYTCIYARNM